MKPAAFHYHRARDLEGACALLAELGEEAKVLAGGQSLVPMMNFRLSRPEHLVDIAAVRELSHITLGGDGLRIGALTTHHAVEVGAERLGAGFGVLAESMSWVGHLPIRTQGTVGGSLAHADATAEWCLLAVLLGARVTAAAPGGQRRTIGAEDLFHGFYTTALRPDEIVTEVHFPHPAPHAALTEHARRHGDFATVSAAVSLELSAGAVTGGRVALGGVAPTPVRIPEAEAVLRRGGAAGPELYTECAAAAAQAIDPPGDTEASPEYRRGLARTLIIRACEEAVR